MDADFGFPIFGMDIACFDCMDILNYGLPQNILVMDDSLWRKGGKSQKSSLIEEDLVKSAPDMSFIKIPPDWSRIPSKAVNMSDEEFEEAIAKLAREDAERGAAMKDAAKGMLAGEEIRIKMLTDYISVVSPDRKATYEKFGGIGNAIYGPEGQELMLRGADGKWQSGAFTEAELARASKFYEIYRQAYSEYEAEYGSVPSSKADPKLFTGYGAYNAYNTYNAYSGYNACA